MTESDIIRIACWRYNHDENGDMNLSSSLYAIGISTVPTPPTTLLGLYRAALAKGADAIEFARLYQHAATTTELKAALTAGVAADVDSWIQIIANLDGAISDQTLNAVHATLSGQRLVDVVAADYPDDNITMPGTITAAMVDTALGR